MKTLTAFTAIAIVGCGAGLAALPPAAPSATPVCIFRFQEARKPSSCLPDRQSLLPHIITCKTFTA